jgi:hypothetical protein
MLTQNIPQEATIQKKLPKIAVRYGELDNLETLIIIKDISAKTVHIFVKPNHCAIAKDEGMDLLRRSFWSYSYSWIMFLWIPK